MNETKAKKRHTGRIIMLVILAVVVVLAVGIYVFLSKTFLTRHPELKGEPEIGKWYRVTPENAKSSNGKEWHGILRKGSENKLVVYFFGGGVSISEETKQYIGSPDTLLITGFSAGGFATSLLADDVIDRFPSAENITVCVDSSLLLYDGWHETAQNLWKSPAEITERLTGDNLVLDSLTALHNKRGERVKILFDCLVRDDTLMQYQAYIREGKMSKTKENGDRFQKDLKEMVEGLQENIEGVGIYIWEYALDDTTKNTQHTILSGQVFEKLNGEKSVAEWITDAINGDVRTYGLELLDKQY